MIKEATASGDTVEEARAAACKILGVETFEAEFEILEMPGKKVFGLFGGTPAKVRCFIKKSPADAAVNYLKDILGKMGLGSVDISVEEQENGALLSLSGEDIGFIIGHRGETLDALQYLSGLVANHVDDSYYRITLDIGNYREKRKETLEILGKKMAQKSLKTGRNCSLEPMNPYERRIIHTAVQTVEGAKSWSEGEETNRHVVIGPEAGERPLPRRTGNSFGNNRGRGGYGGRSGGPRRQGSPAPRPVPEETAPKASVPAAETEPVNAAPVPAAEPVKVPEKAPAKVSAPLYGRIDIKK